MAAPAWSSGVQPLSWVRRRAGPEPAPRLSRRGGSRRLREAAAPGLAQASASFPKKLEVQQPQPQPQPEPERKTPPPRGPAPHWRAEFGPASVLTAQTQSRSRYRAPDLWVLPTCQALKGATPPQIVASL